MERIAMRSTLIGIKSALIMSAIGLAIGLAGATASVAAPLTDAAADNGAVGNAKEITVAYGDLDLGTAAGRSQLMTRLQEAASQLCSPVLTPPDSEVTAHEHMVIYRACIGRSSQRAMAKVTTVRN
jgi:UrcA family protein